MLKIGARKSVLSQKQVEEVLNLIQPQCPDCQPEFFDTQGDQDQHTQLTDQNVPDNFFTDTLDQALLEGKIDVAVHSAKDVPQQLHADLRIIALTKAENTHDAWVGKCSWDKLSQGHRVGTSSTLRQEQTLNTHPDVTLVPIRGTIEQRLDLINKNEVDGIIVAACALKRLGLEDQITDILPWEGFPLQGQLAIVAKKDNNHMAELFAPFDVRPNYAKVSLVGAGPGDPKLITLKAIQALEQADLVLYDYIVDERLLEHAPKAEHIFVGKKKGDHCKKQYEINTMLREYAQQGKRVVRLKGGDPLIFARGGEEMHYLQNFHIPVDVIPGVSSATGLASLFSIPLTDRRLASSVAFVTAHMSKEHPDQPQHIHIPKADTLVFLMGLSKLEQITQQLRKDQWSETTPVIIISNGSWQDEEHIIGTLENIVQKSQDEHIKPPAIIIVGKVVDYYYHAR